MQVNVLTAEGPTLDYLVSTAPGYVLEALDGLDRQLWMVQKSDGPELLAFPIWPDDRTRRYSTDWARGGWLVDNHIVSLDQNGTGDGWTALAWCADRSLQRADGPTALVAVARCFAASRLGEWARVPDCLIPQPAAPLPSPQVAALQTRIQQLEAELRGDHWPHDATVKLKWVGVGYESTFGWAKRDAGGALVSAYSGVPLDESQWEVVEERQAPAGPGAVIS